MHTEIIQVPFYYVRHGQTDWNRDNRAMGQTDIPLNSHGINQAMSARNNLVGVGITTICYSPLSRAKMTAEIFNEVLHCNLIEMEELQEFNLGPHAGKVKEKWFHDWRSGTQLADTETYSDFIDRSLKGVNKALSLPGLVLIIAHGGVYWSIEHATQTRLEKDIPNCMPVFHSPPQNENEKWKISLSAF